jgi:hypothetical protein
MAELDLIPIRYHRRRRFLTRVAQAGAVAVASLVGLLGARVVIAERIALRSLAIEQMRVEHARAEHDRNERARLEAERERLVQRLAVLDGLRGGIAAKQMFAVVDAALDEDVWFSSLRFQRAGEIVEEEPEAVHTGYFIILPQENPSAPRRAWRLETHMEIEAEAADHSALAGFVRRLSERPEIESARILNTQIQQAGAGGRVRFELAVLVRSRS